MDELVSKRALLKLFRRNSITDKVTFSDGKSTNETIKTFPAVDAVQVVRCKNCRYYDEYFNPNTKNYCYVDGGPIHRIMPPDGFCSDGERKDNGSTSI